MSIIKILTIALSFFTFSSCKEKDNVLEGMECKEVALENEEEETQEEVEEETEEEPVVEKTAVKFLALGDSYTICQNVPVEDRWPNQLKEKFIDSNFVVDKVDIIAQTGWTTSNLLTAINNTPIEDYNLVSLLIGVNNQYQNKPFSLFETEFDLLLDTAITIAGNKDQVFVVSIPDYGVTPFGGGNSQAIAHEIDEYNDYIEAKCLSLGVLYINVTEISRTLGSSNGALTNDNLHPSASQYAEWVNEMLPEVLELLE